MINPGGIPQIPGDMDALAQHATSLTGVGGNFATTGQQVNTTWQGLAGVYKAPEIGELLSATAPVQSVSASVGADIKSVGSALTTYAAEVKAIKARLAQLKTEAEGFVNSVKDDDDWKEDQGKVDKNNNLINAVSDEMAKFFDAQRRCANAINALYGGKQYKAVSGEQPKDGEYGYTADQLRAATKAGADLPWGKAEEHDGGFWGGVGSFFVGIGEGFMDMVKGLGGLIGYGENGWSWSNAGHAWAGLGKFALAVVAYSPATFGIGAVVDQTVGIPGLKKGELGNTLLNAGKSIIAYDDWGKDPARAGGKATFNIVSAVIGTKGAGAGLRGAGAAAQGSKIAAVAKSGTLMVRAGEAIGQLPKVSDVALAAGRKFGGLFDGIKGALHFDKPDVNLPHVNEPTPHPRAETPSTPERGSVGDNLGNQPSIPDRQPEPVGAGHGHGNDSSPNPHTGGDHNGNGHDSNGNDGNSNNGGGDHNGNNGNNGNNESGNGNGDGNDSGGNGGDHDGGQPPPHDPTQPPPGVTFDDPTHPRLGSDGKYYVREGVDHDVPIDDPAQPGRTITDIDNPKDGVLWEEKSAVNAGDVNRWVDKHITKKIESYIEAQQYIAGYERAPVGVEFTRAGADPAFRAAVERAAADLRIKYPNETILVKWAP